ncbi:MAG: DUF4325 domain-containing protein [Nitrospinaceae bacterium]|nr:STAS-like domain-containing protein [Nitrospinaceae bacterium]NIR53523.1 STAS-like domain-containing protein [Nitrospinaceae bacterium]NIS83922.1 STAS-like domain-containing protein [Nitrospinaceae bacterium]NIT80730.1 STAS-like domain-containing protein [Nitrospinaceae bacterium]NIU43039.1 STAS-like domain-containing protein [Nitrospinaceae bacterium]
MEPEYTIKVFDLMQTSTPSGRTSEDGSPAGDTIRNLVLEHWDRCEKIVILFDGIAKMTRPFIDEAFAKILETKTLDDFNAKLYFPDASDKIVKDMNEAVKLRLKIIRSQREKMDSL